MEHSLFLKTNCGKIFAEIKNVRRSDTLLSVRERVDITDRQNFNFLLFGTPLKSKQESKTLVQDCSVLSKSDGNAEITIRIINAPVENIKAVHPAPSHPASRLFVQTQSKVVSSADCLPGGNKPVFEKGAFGNCFAPQKKISPKLRKLEVYTEDEISEVTGLLSKEKMRFHNNMVSQIEKDESLQGWMKQELLGVIESSWVMKRTELLKVKVKELVVKEQIAFEIGEGKNIMRNLDEVQKAHFDVKRGYENFCSDLDRNQGKREVLEKKFDAVFSNLKQSQGKLHKSLESLHVSTHNVDKPDGDKKKSVIYDELSDGEIENIAKDIKTEYESN